MSAVRTSREHVLEELGLFLDTIERTTPILRRLLDCAIAQDTAAAESDDAGRQAYAFMRDRIDLLKDALRLFGVHQPACAGWTRAIDANHETILRLMDASRCTCGLTTFLATT